MEVEKWYVYDGKAQVNTVQDQQINQTNNDSTKDLTTINSINIEPDKNYEPKPTEEKIEPMEPEWKQEEPKNCFKPF